ncbi:RnfH family protein [Candidatus Ichthyocystis hellenicum]|uniref:RnfH family protein n=1 Tax=Candidatus Ichthyocystis hellenicum TaxID=1561003 RepID=UPI000B889789|nr:RnfH family protein [Candidatus Ichthyocystis hellenicum]
MSTESLNVKMVYALREEAVIISLSVPVGSTIEDVIKMSGILDRFPEIDLDQQKVGVYGRLSDLSAAVHDGDRVEIYRPILVDPKEVRRLRANKVLLSRGSKPTGGTT